MLRPQEAGRARVAQQQQAPLGRFQQVGLRLHGRDDGGMLDGALQASSLRWNLRGFALEQFPGRPTLRPRRGLLHVSYQTLGIK